MPIRFYCPLGHRLHAPETQQGKLVHCPACRQRVIVPVLDLARPQASESVESTGPKNSFGQPLNVPPEHWAFQDSTHPGPLPPIAPLDSSPEGASVSLLASSETAGRLDGGNQTASVEQSAVPGGNGQAKRPAPESPSASDLAAPLVEWVELVPEAEQQPPQPTQREPFSSAGQGPALPTPTDTLPPQQPTQPAEQPEGFSEPFFVEEPPASPPEEVFWEAVGEEFAASESAPSQDASASLPQLSKTPTPTQSLFGPPKTETEPVLPPAQEPFPLLPESGEAPWENHQSPRSAWTDSVRPTAGPPSSAQEPARRIPTSPHAAFSPAQGRERGSMDRGTGNRHGRGSESAHWLPPTGVDLEPVRRQEVRWLGFWLGLIVLFSIGPAFRHLLLSLAPGWARVVVLLGLWELAYVGWMVLSVHRVALWVVMTVFAAGATLSAVTTAFTLVAAGHGSLPGGLDQIRRWAPSWFGCVLAVQTLGAYLAGRLAFLWGQMDRRFARHRLESSTSGVSP